jgi:hypothetical protein
MHGRGQSQITIFETLGVNRSTITIFIRKSKNVKVAREDKRARSVGKFCVLTAAQEHRIRQDILDKILDQMKHPFRWIRRITIAPAARATCGSEKGVRLSAPSPSINMPRVAGSRSRGSAEGLAGLSDV